MFWLGVKHFKISLSGGIELTTRKSSSKDYIVKVQAAAIGF